MLPSDNPKPFIDPSHPLLQLLLLAGMAMLGSFVFTLVGLALVKPLFHVDGIYQMMTHIQGDVTSIKNDLRKVNALKFVQMMASVGTFLVPAILFAIFRSKEKDFFSLKKRVNPLLVLLAIIIVPLSTPLVQLFYTWNQHLILPGFLHGLEKSMQEAEKGAETMMSIFLVMPDISSLLMNIVLIGIIPALSEELLFRGCVQHILSNAFKNKHVAIWVSAALFSFIHFQFYGFVPRMLLGGMFGYLYYWSGTLWIPIIAHLVTNGAQVILSYFYQKQMVPFDPNEDISLSVSLLFTATVFLIAALFLFYRTSKKHNLIMNTN